MIELKRLSVDAVPAALAKAERYRLLNEARAAESICRDILAVDPGNDEARVLFVLALTDQFRHRLGALWREAEAAAAALRDPYQRLYYRGILHERRAKAVLRAGRFGSEPAIHEDFRRAMACFEEAISLAPHGDDSALLRWNDCARVLNEDPSIGRAAEHPEPRMHD